MNEGVEAQDITRPAKPKQASGRPGAMPRWASGAKTIVGTAVASPSRIWYTVNNGTLAEIYFPDVDKANTRSVRFVVTGADGFFSDGIWDAHHTVSWLEPGAPACRIESVSDSGAYRLTKELVPDPARDTLLLRGRFSPNQRDDLRLFLVIDAHLGDRGADNDGWVGHYKGDRMVFAQRGAIALACLSSPPALAASVGYIGTSDALTVLRRGDPLPDANSAPDGNVALSLELDYKSSADGTFVISIAGGSNPAEAAQQARAGVLEDFDRTSDIFLRQWREHQARLHDLPDLSGHPLDMYRVSTAVLETHQSKRFPGGFIASLSLPWGFDHTDTDVSGYHVLWPRDMVEVALGKLASGDLNAARATLFYLACTQDHDGGWSQNMWLDGTPHWKAVQMDSIALPILLADKLRRDSALGNFDPHHLVHRATRFLLRNGPVTQQDRWETTPGYSPNTMASEVAALLAAADFAEHTHSPAHAEFLRETADAWNDAIDELTFVQDTPLARRHGIRGYYLRMAPPRRIEARDIGHLRIRMPNVRLFPKSRRAIDIVSPGFLALVRFGLRAPDDPRILDSIRLIDATLKHDMTTGPGWARSTDDGYGENAAGLPFRTTGIGRCWPLLAGERGHYELAAGHRHAALELLRTIARQTSSCGMIPEQVWDAPDIPERYLFNGHPTGSGMPLAWAHAEYIKLLRSLHLNHVWDRVPQAEARYLRDRRSATFQIWNPTQPRAWISHGKDLRLDLPAPARIHWSARVPNRRAKPGGTAQTTDTGFGLHCATLPTRELPPGSRISIDTEPAEHIHRGKSRKSDSFIVRVRA